MLRGGLWIECELDGQTLYMCQRCRRVQHTRYFRCPHCSILIDAVAGMDNSMAPLENAVIAPEEGDGSVE